MTHVVYYVLIIASSTLVQGSTSINSLLYELIVGLPN